MDQFNFGPASPGEIRIFGASRPGYPSHSVSGNEVADWLSFMRRKGMERVCCLLGDSQLAYYEGDLLDTYRDFFGERNVCWAPVEDHELCDAETLMKIILPFLVLTDRDSMQAVVHCSAGIGRTGLVMAAWLIHGREIRRDDALAMVKEAGRNPYEAVGTDPLKRSKLHALLDACKDGRGAVQ